MPILIPNEFQTKYRVYVYIHPDGGNNRSTITTQDGNMTFHIYHGQIVYFSTFSTIFGVKKSTTWQGTTYDPYHGSWLFNFILWHQDYNKSASPPKDGKPSARSGNLGIPNNPDFVGTFVSIDRANIIQYGNDFKHKESSGCIYSLRENSESIYLWKYSNEEDKMIQYKQLKTGSDIQMNPKIIIGGAQDFVRAKTEDDLLSGVGKWQRVDGYIKYSYDPPKTPGGDPILKETVVPTDQCYINNDIECLARGEYSSSGPSMVRHYSINTL